MTNSEIVKVSRNDTDSADSNDGLGKPSSQKFYSPLSVTGYLTPLQRKKLREKRKDTSIELNDSSSNEIPKARIIKRKRRTESSSDRNKEQIKRKKMKDSIQQVQYNVSKIVQKTKYDSNKPKKFFKSSSSDRLDKANFTMPLVFKRNAFSTVEKHVKETLVNSKKLSELKENLHEHSLSEEAKDLSLKNISMENEMCSNNVSEIPSMLEQEKLEQIVFPGEKKMVFEFNWPSDEECLKRRERARELARKKNVLKEANKEDYNENEMQKTAGSQVKLYPIFQIQMKKQSRIAEMKSCQRTGNKKKVSLNHSDQMIIDAGQKEIGPKVCSICNMIYTSGEEEEERLHLNYHDMHIIYLKFPGWKEENVVGEYCDGRVIMVRKSDKSFKLKKVEEVLEIANRDLGFQSSAMPVKPDLTFVLFVSKDKTVAGCLVAEPIFKAFQVMPASQSDAMGGSNWCSSSKAVPAICGVNRIWVAHNFRRQKVASRMVDCLRCHFIHGHVVGIREIAFTDPSPAGQNFAAAYTGTQHFLVYK